MPNFALSRRQRGFESRWGYKIKVFPFLVMAEVK